MPIDERGRNVTSTRARTLRQALAATALCFATSLAGCASPEPSVDLRGSGGGERSVSGGGTDGVPLAEGVDRERAFVSLDEIEPAVEAPKPAADVPELSERAQDRIRRANDFIADERFTEAAIQLERALRLSPNHPEIRSALAALHWRAGNVERARQSAERAIRDAPASAAPYYILGRYRLQQGDTVEASRLLRIARLCPDFTDDAEVEIGTIFSLAQSLEELGYLSAADSLYRDFQRAAEALPRPIEGVELKSLVLGKQGHVAVARAGILEKLGRASEAADVLLALDASELAPPTQRWRVRLLARAGYQSEAVASVRALEASASERVELLGEIFADSDDEERLVTELRALRAAAPDDAELVVKIAEVLRGLGRSDLASAELAGFLADHPNASLIRLALVDEILEGGSVGEAIPLLADALVAEPEVWNAPAFAERLGVLAGLLESGRALPGATSAAERYVLGESLRRAGRVDEAIEPLEAAVSAEPAAAAYRTALSRAYLDSYRYDDAIRVARGDGENAEDDAAGDVFELSMILGEAYDRLDQLDEAERYFRAALQQRRSSTEAMFLLANVHRRAGKSNQAKKQLRVLLEADRQHEPARELLAFLHMEDNQLQAAVEQIRILARTTTSPATRARCQSLLNPELREKPEEIRELLRAAMEEGGEDAITWISVAETYDAFSADKKRDAFARAAKLDPANEDAVLGLVSALESLLEYEQAAEELAKLLPRRPNQHGWRLNLAQLYLYAHDWEKALQLLEGVLARDDVSGADRRNYRVALMESLRQAGREEELLARIETWAGEGDESIVWERRLAQEYVFQEQAARAVPLFEEMYEARPMDWQLLGELVNALRAAGQEAHAFQRVLGRLGGDPENDAGVWMLAVSLAQSKRVDAAIELVRNRLLHTTQRAIFQDFMIDQYRTAGRYDDAIDLCDTLMAQVSSLIRQAHERGAPVVGRPSEPVPVWALPNHPFSLDQLIARLHDIRILQLQCLLDADDFLEAERRASDWLNDTLPSAARLQLQMAIGDAFRGRGLEDASTEAYKKALELEPQSAFLNNNIAYVWIDRGERLEEAERMIRFAVARAPRNRAYLDTFGWLLYKMGDFAGARKWLERAVGTTGPGDPVLHDHLGDTFWRLGDGDRAVEQWEKALAVVEEIGPDSLRSDDERRVRDEASDKIEAAKSGREPVVAALGEKERGETGDGGANGGD